MTRVIDLYGYPWKEREYIVVLYYYSKYRRHPRHPGTPYVQKLSELLRRTPGSILMRMENFASLDPEVSLGRKGLGNVNDLCRRLFQKWFYKPEELEGCAKFLVQEAEEANIPTLFEPEPVPLPKAFGKYELLDELGRGSFGVVFSCLNTEDDKPYAIKLIRVDMKYDKECLHRFRREIRALKTVEHPNVIRLHEDNLETEQNCPAFVMDLAAGTLTARLCEAKEQDPHARPLLPLEEGCHILRSILNAVGALHTGSERLIHRDINPNNVLQSLDGEWVLADFSLAKFLPPVSTSTTFSTLSHQAWGTGFYASPEQYQDLRQTDERSDVYALGVLLWDLFSKEGPPPRRECPGLPTELASVFLKSHEFDRKDRYRTVEEFRNAFEAAVAIDYAGRANS